MERVPCCSPLHFRFTCASNQLMHYQCVRYLVRCRLESILPHCYDIPNFAETLCCCRSSNLWSPLNLWADFAWSSTGSDRLTNKQINWYSTLFTVVVLSSCLVQANDSSCSRSHRLLLHSATVHFPLLVERTGKCFPFYRTAWNGNISYCTCMYKYTVYTYMFMRFKSDRACRYHQE